MVHPLLRRIPRIPRPAAPLGTRFEAGGTTLYLELDNKAVAFMRRETGSWRALLLAWKRGMFTRCMVTWMEKRGAPAYVRTVLDLDRIETAGEVADAVVQHLKLMAPDRFSKA